MKAKLIFASVMAISMTAATAVSCSPTEKSRIEGADAANAESVVGATDNLPVIEESAAQIAPEVATVDTLAQ